VKAPSNAEAIHVVGRSDDIAQIKFVEADGSTKTAVLDARNSGFNVGSIANVPLTFVTNNSERMRIDASGNLLVGKTAQNHTDVGHTLYPTGGISVVRSGGQCAVLNRTSSDGNIIDLRRDGATIGKIDGSSASMAIFATGVNNCGWAFLDNSAIVPMKNQGTADNLVDLGTSSLRMDDIFATNGTIQTSDRNEKQDIEELTDAEKRVAVVAKGLMRKFRWKDKVAEKGDKARTHFGIIAQDLQDAFTAESLDATKYAMFCSDTWTNDDGSEQTRLGVRYSELLAFIISAI